MLAAATAAEYFSTNLWPHIEEINGIVKAKLDAVEDALDAAKDAFPYHSHPKGGLFIWVKLPDDTDVNRLLSIADSRNVKYGTGKSFHSQNEDIKYLRIAYGYASLDDIREGVRCWPTAYARPAASRSRRRWDKGARRARVR